MTKSSEARKARKNKKAQGDHRMVHWLIKQTAQELAGAYYEDAASHQKHGNEFYKAFPSLEFFVEDQWPMFIMTTREILLQMLNSPMTPEPQKQEIYHAILLDKSLPFSYQEAQLTNINTH